MSSISNGTTVTQEKLEKMVVQNCGPAVNKLYCGKGEIANIITY